MNTLVNLSVTKNQHCFFLWERAETNQELIKVSNILKGITRTEVFM